MMISCFIQRPGFLKLPGVFIAALFAAVLSGCGGGTGTKLGEVNGTVTLDGKPLEQATVTFTPDTGGPSMGVTDASGYYTLDFSSTRSGALAGTSHAVRITTGRPADEDKDGNELPAVPEKVPAKYNVQSTLAQDVKPGQNTFDFDLKSK